MWSLELKAAFGARTAGGGEVIDIELKADDHCNSQKEEKEPKTETETEMDKLDKKRADMGLKASATDSSGHFNVLKFYALLKLELPVHYVMARRIFNDLASEAVSESTFSTHSRTQTKARKKLDPEITSAFVYCNKNHSRYFERVKGKIRDMYTIKFGGLREME